MLGLPSRTEVKKRIPKEAIFRNFHMNSQAKARFNADIKSVVIVNEIMPNTVTTPSGQEITGFYFIRIVLKNKSFDNNNLILLSRMIKLNIVLVLQHEDKVKLAINHLKLFQTDWQNINEYKIQLQGLTLDSVWENLIIQIADIQIELGNTLEQQIIIDEEQKILQNKITKLETKAWCEQQPKKKFQLVQEISELKKQEGICYEIR